MFTSRAEYRLSLRAADNADQRLTPRAIALGCVGEARKKHFHDKMDRLASARADLQARSYGGKELSAAGIATGRDGRRRLAFELLSGVDVDFSPHLPISIITFRNLTILPKANQDRRDLCSAFSRNVSSAKLWR